MGVTGLLQHLKSIQEPTTLSNYKGKTLAVDTYGWLHRGLISCAQDLCTDVPTRGYITSVMKKVDMLRHFGVEPYMVFDGSPLPTKEGTNAERKAKRIKAREAAALSLKKGDRKSAWKEFMKAASVTPEMAKSIMVELDRKHVKYVVAPYEADPQMVYLEKIGAVDGILSEDSDLLIFGCNKLITKLTDYGECVEIDRANFGKIKNLDTYTALQLRSVAILSGCDYTKGVPGVGLKTAFNLIHKLGSLDRVIASLKNDGKNVPEGFDEEATLADLAFQFQKVFDPKEKQLSTLNEYPEIMVVEMTTVELCCGRTLESTIQAGICTGRIHPDTHHPLLSREQNLQMGRSASMTSKRTTKVQGAQKSESFSAPAKGIDSFFQSAKVGQSKEVEKVLKRLEVDRSLEVKLSPISKKLRRISNDNGAIISHSKFFGIVPKLPATTPVLQPESKPPPPMDSSFLTGDSEITDDFSSPVKRPETTNILGELNDFKESVADDQYLTDMDDDLDGSMTASMIRPPLVVSNKSIIVNNESDEGYDNEIDESPVKFAKISGLWRERFLMSEDILMSKGSSRVTKLCTMTLQKDVAVKIRTSIDDSESLGPSTPNDTCVELKLPDVTSQPKSLQRSEFNISESEEEQLPRRPHAIGIKLLQFAFTGR